jgi:two-component sensor histidine kinase
VRWLRCDGVPRLDDAHSFLGYTGCNVDITAVKLAQERQSLLINELNHRVKNTLATVQSVAMQTLRNAATTEQAREDFEVRLIALSRAHDVLTRENWDGANLREIVAQAVEPYRRADENRFKIGGPAVRLSPRMALALAMALQELATNAVKYGALSNASGHVEITWKVERGREPRLKLRWCETGGPSVEAPHRRGFGARLLERSLAQDLDGAVNLQFDPAGLVCTVDAPVQKS